MSNATEITIVGNLVDDVQLRFTPAGAAVANFRVASTPKKLNRETNAWEDDKDNALFLTCTVWRQMAENCAESLQRGMRVIVQGRLKQRSFEQDGAKRTVFEVDVDEVGPALRFATAKVTRSGGSGTGRQDFQQARQQHAPADDPWSSAPAWSGGGTDEPPF